MSDTDDMDFEEVLPSSSQNTLRERNGLFEDSGGTKPSIEQMYQKKSQLEHILLRPDTYIGSVEYTDKSLMWIYDMNEDKLVQREIAYVPGLYKIFDEILVNAADNKQRDKKMNLIKVDINKETNTISVFNNGKGIPVVLHKEEKIYVPELIFGTLLTSSNYNDDEKKTTGGRNGYGAKLCNIFSTEFTLETSCKEYKQQFKQTWINNMTKDKDPVVSKATGDDFTKITFKPDLQKFKMKELEDDIIGLMARRAYDIAGTSQGVKVYLNGKCLPVKSFKEYAEKYVESIVGEDGEKPKVIYEKINDRWEVALTVSERGFQSVSFVNSIATSKGGRHVDYIADQVSANLIDTIKKKAGGAKSGVNVKPFQIKNHMWVFVNCLIENPTFDSQTKENMTLQAKSFGSKGEMTEKFYKEALKCGIVDAVLSWVRFKQQEQADKKCSTKKSTKVKGIPKLEDANEAGTKNSFKCTLILTEGDSAKTLAVSGLGVVGRDYYGVFPLRGKMLNVRDCPLKQINDNQEIGHMIKILGLQYRLKYETEEERKTLRYGRVMIMADQDQDGSHIKGLLINWIHCNWPALMKNNFVEEFITPIVKASKGNTSLSFFSLPEYMEWRQNTENWKTFKIKYYKGKFESPEQICQEFFEVRKKKYIERKAFLEGMLEAQSKRLSNQARFIVAKIRGEIIMENRKKKNIVEQLIKEKFDPDPVKAWKDLCKKKELEMCGEIEIEEGENEEDDQDTSSDAALKKRLVDYDYLVNMALIKLSEEEKDRLLKESGDKQTELETLKNKTWADLWEHDLDVFEEALKKQEEKERQDIEGAIQTAQAKLLKKGSDKKSKKNKVNLNVSSFKPNPEAEIVKVEFESLKNKYEKKPKKVKAPAAPKVKGDEAANLLDDADVKSIKEKTEKKEKPEKQAKTSTKKTATKRKKKDSESSEDYEDFELDSPPVAKKPATRNIKRPVITIDSDSDFE
uniref:DNA topoisomerase 2 n=1 Tax=Parastrongyloides trichosuri TaxID=131310 RepID=A0A0N4ZG69_PARTI